MIEFISLKRFHRRRWKVKLYILSAIIGAIVGIFILFPLNEFIFFYDQEQYATSLGSYVFDQLSSSLKVLAVIYNDPVADNKIDPPQTINFYRQHNKYCNYN